MFEGTSSITDLSRIRSAISAPASLSGFVLQRTLKTAITCTGVGLHSGQKISMTLHPAEIDSGIRFRRTDIAGQGAIIPAHYSHVSDTRLNTCVANADGVGVRTIEHLMAALSGLGVDNVLIDINGAEVPVMDGSAAPFLFLIDCAGVLEQAAPRRAIEVLKRVVIRDGNKMASLAPATEFSLSMGIDFPVPAIRSQTFSMTFTPARFRSDVSRARTFGFEQEVAAMRAAGLARGGSLHNAVVIASEGDHVLNEDGLRFDDEFVRHKTLDAVGDLYLAGGPLLAHFHGERTGHALNNRLLRELFADSSAWRFVPLQDRPAQQPLKLVVNG